VEVVDTVGAGDSFLAACLFGLRREGALLSRQALRGLSADVLLRCLSFACRAAALTCSRPGADPPFLRELLA
jgi:fructokinase